jgi:hypothetical protein
LRQQLVEASLCCRLGGQLLVLAGLIRGIAAGIVAQIAAIELDDAYRLRYDDAARAAGEVLRLWPTP